MLESEYSDPLESLVRKLQRCSACGGTVSLQDDVCGACGFVLDDEFTIDIVEGSSSGRISSGGPNLRKLLASLEALEGGQCTFAHAVEVLLPVIDIFRRWLRQMEAVPREHVEELPDLASMLADYVPLATRILQQLEVYCSDLQACDVAAARGQMQAIAVDMCLLDRLHLHYESLGY